MPTNQSRWISLWVLCLLASVSLHAQPPGFKPMKDPSPLKEMFMETARELKSMKAAFTQVRHMALLEEEVQSKGHLVFLRPDQIRLEFETPFYYLVVSNGKEAWIKNEKQTTRALVRQQPGLKQMNQLIADCLGGTLFSNPNYEIQTYESAQAYLLELRPKAGKDDLIEKVRMTVDKRSAEVKKLRLVDKGGDYTHMEFEDIRKNVKVETSLFNLH